MYNDQFGCRASNDCSGDTGVWLENIASADVPTRGENYEYRVSLSVYRRGNRISEGEKGRAVARVHVNVCMQQRERERESERERERETKRKKK